MQKLKWNQIPVGWAVTRSSLEQKVWVSNLLPVIWTHYRKRLVTAAIILQKKLCWPGAMLLQLHFIHQVALARKQRRDLLVFESSCYLPTCLLHTVEASHCPFNCWTSSRKKLNSNFYSLCFDSTGNRTHVYLFSNKRSIHSITDWLMTRRWAPQNCYTLRLIFQASIMKDLIDLTNPSRCNGMAWF